MRTHIPINGNRFRVVLGVILLLLMAITVVAQIAVGTIVGVVKDSSGGVVPGATITIRSTESGSVRKVTTGDDGAYRAPALPVGHYNVEVEKAGFKTLTQENVILEVAEELAVNVALEVGTSSQEVNVTAEAPLVNTTTSSLGGLVNDEQMAELPLNGRNYADLTLMQPGVTQLTAISTANGLAGNWFSSNGAPTISNLYTLDGGPTNNQFAGTDASFAGTTLGVDGIREYKVITNTFSAEYGMVMGSQVVMVSKGGTNQFHGDAYDYLRNSAMDARNFFDSSAGSGGRRLPEFQRNNFGGAVGGPIRKDKTFFFGVYESLRQNQGFTALDNVLAPGCHPANATAANNYGAGTVITPAECPQISASVQIPNATAGAFVALYPMPTIINNAAGIYQFSFPSSSQTTVNYGQMRVDQNFSSSDMLFVRYTVDNSVQNGASPNALTATSGIAWPQFRGLGLSRNQYLSVGENHIFSSSILNSARISYGRTNLGVLNLYTDPTETQAPFQYVQGNPMGTLTVTNLSAEGPAGNLGPPTVTHIQNLYTGSDDVNYSKGKHGLKFGFLYNRFGQEEQSGSGLEGSLTFNSIARFLAGTPNSFSSETAGSNLNRYFMYNTFGMYAQDDWRVTSRLTLNIGLRYEFMTAPTELSGRESHLTNIFNSTLYTGNYTTTPGQAFVFGPVMDNTSRRNFSPRVGFAWDVTGKGKTSIRGGGGLFYDLGNLGEYLDQIELSIPPYASASTVTLAQNSTALLATPFVYPAGSVGTSLHTADYNFTQPHLLEYNLTAEQQLPWNIGLQVSYVGSRGWNLISELTNVNYVIPTASVNGIPYWDNNLTGATGCESIVPSITPNGGVCRINPNWDGIAEEASTGISWYNALQVVLNRRLSRGLQFQSVYTWSQALDTAQGSQAGVDCTSPGADETIDPQHLYGSKGPACFDATHNWRFNLLYHFPNVKSEGIVSKLANGWWMGNIVSIQSGYGFTPIIGSRSNSGQADRASLGNAALTNGNGSFIPFDKNTVIEGSPTQWFNPNMFMLAPAITCPGTAADVCQTYGNASRDMLRGPGLGQWNFSMVKDTPLRFIGEGGNLEFRAEFFNLLNRANFAQPNGSVFTGKNTDLTSYSEAPLSTAGQILSTITNSRQIQLALKLIF